MREPSEYPTYVDLHSGLRMTITLNGTWQIRLDPKELGKEEGWFQPEITFDESIMVPGTWQAQGFGEPFTVDVFKEFLKAKYLDKKSPLYGSELPLKTQYLGSAWYKLKFQVTRKWPEEKVWLKLGAVNPSCEVWINGEYIGSVSQPGVPTRFDITERIRYEGVNDITIRVHEENRGLGMLYNIVTWWSGLWRDVNVEITRKTWIDDLWIIPDIDKSQAHIRVTVVSEGKRPEKATLKAVVFPYGKEKSHVTKKTITRSITIERMKILEVDIPIEQTRLWSPSDPFLYCARIDLEKDGELLDSVKDQFGMRKIEARGNKLFLNNKPLYLRGFGDDGMYPNTLHPETDIKLIKKHLQMAKDYGFNYAYPCTIMQPEEYLDAADEVGMLLKYDAPATLAFERNGPGSLSGDHTEQERLIEEQWTAMLKWTQNHPSIIIYSPGSEIPKENPNPPKLYRIAKGKDPTRLVLSWSDTEDTADIAQTEQACSLQDPIDPSERLHHMMETDEAWRLTDNRSHKPGIPRIIHEYCGAEALPNPTNISKYDKMIPLHELEIEGAAQTLGIEGLILKLVANSRKIENSCRKLLIEEARKVEELAGYQMWLIQDLIGYPQGIFDAFWNPKDIAAEEFTKSNGESVLLMNEISCTTKKCFWGGEEAEFEIFVSHQGERPIIDGILRWKLISRPEGKTLLAGERSGIQVDGFTTKKFLNLSFHMPKVKSATEAELHLILKGKELSIENNWRLWLYPRESLERPEQKVCLYDVQGAEGLYKIYRSLYFTTYWDKGRADIVIANGIDDEIMDYLKSGGKVILLLKGNERLFREKSLLKAQFMPRWPHTQGIDISATIIDEHPSLYGFPHDGFCDYQFYHLIVNTKEGASNLGRGESINLDKFSARIEPIIRVFSKNANAAYLFEVKVGKGKMLLTTLRFMETVGESPEATYLLYNLLRYVAGGDFVPRAETSEKELEIIKRV